MNKMIKKLFPLLCVCMMFSFVSEVFATTTFSKYQGYLCYNKNNYKIIKLGGIDWHITDIDKKCNQLTNGAQTYVIKTNDKKKLAFCADKMLEFNESAGVQFGLDADFSAATGCATSLNADGSVKTTGDCSQMVGYVIGEALKDKYLGYNAGKVIDRNQFSDSYYIRGTAEGYSSAVEVNKWWNAQMAVWVYLGKFAPSPYNYYNNHTENSIVEPTKIWDDNLNELPIKIIKNAFENYKNRPSRIGKDVKFSVKIKNNSDTYDDISSGDRTFYYVPNGSGDSTNNGVYVTRTIKITNTDSDVIKFTLTGPSSASGSKFDICDAGTKRCGISGFDLAGGNSKEVFFVSYHNFSGNVNFSLTADFKKPLVSYNSKRYFDDEAHQGVLVGSDSSTEEKIKNYSFVQKTVEHYGCPEISDEKERNFNKDNIYLQNKKTEPVSKECANNVVKVKADVESKRKLYEVNFIGCTTMTIDLKNKSKVGIILNEVTYFKYGTFDPAHSLWPGEGFSFSNKNTGIITEYSSKIIWDYANKIGATPYYYNYLDPTSYDASLIKDDIEKEIETKLFGNPKVEFKFSTLNSNESVNSTDSRTEIKVVVDINVDNYDSSTRKYTLSAKNFEMNDSYFSLNGDVVYEKKSNYPINGGNKYYVPLNYNDSKFPFDISKTNLTNLSIVPGIDFYYSADCDVDVDDVDPMLKEVRYRSIDLNNPFPKAKSSTEIPANWRAWYADSANIIRLKTAYDKPVLYEILIDSNKNNKINSINNFYVSWNGIRPDGKSEFILNPDFKFELNNYVSNAKSFCGIGNFSTNCDQYYR